MKNLQTITLIAATIATGLMAGLFAAFAYSVMPGLGRSSDRTFIEAMQNINKSILNGFFMLPFMGAVPLLILAAVLAWRGHGRSALPWIIAALVLYVIAFFITSGVNVPLNDKLAKAGDPHKIHDLVAVRHHFEGSWVAWNIVRAILHTAAFGCLTWALVVYGADRLHQTSAVAQPANAGAPAPYAPNPYGPATHNPHGPATYTQYGPATHTRFSRFPAR